MEWARVLEALLFAATEPMEPSRLAAILREGPEGGQGWSEVKEQEVREELAQLSERLAPRGLILREVAGGFRIGTAPDLSGWVAKLKGVARPPRLSPPPLRPWPSSPIGSPFPGQRWRQCGGWIAAGRWTLWWRGGSSGLPDEVKRRAARFSTEPRRCFWNTLG